MKHGMAQRPSRLATAAAAGGSSVAKAMRFLLLLLGLAIVIQSTWVVHARPQDLITGVDGMADIIRRAMPPDFSTLPDQIWPTLETIDIAIFGTLAGVIMAAPLAVLAAAMAIGLGEIASASYQSASGLPIQPEISLAD